MTAVLGAVAVLIAAAVVASLMPAARASRVDVMQALRSEQARPRSVYFIVILLLPEQHRDDATAGPVQS